MNTPATTTAPAVETVAEVEEAIEVQAVETKAPKAKTANLIGLARKAVPNGSRLFAAEVGTSDAGVVSYRLYVAKVGKDGQINLSDVTKTLRMTDGIDLPTRGRPRTEVVVRSKGEGRLAAHTVLARRIAQVLHGDEGKVTIQAL